MGHKTDSTALSKGPCAACGSSDGNVLYDDGHRYCFVCEVFTKGANHSVQSAFHKPDDNTDWTQGDLTDRGIKAATARKYGVRIETVAGKITKHEYPYFNAAGDKVGAKVRVCESKEFFGTGNIKQSVLFGQDKFPAGGLAVTITEGECDAMAAYELTGSQYPVVSLKSASGAAKQAKDQYKYLDSFKKIVLCFDTDEAGQKAAAEVAKVFEPKKVRIMQMEHKDANEYLKAGEFKKFVNAWHNAEVYTPAGILNLADIGEKLYDEGQQQTCLYPWEGLNDKLFGIRTGELVTFTAGTGTGKSSILRELMYHVLSSTKDNIGVLALEENVRQTCFHLMSVPANDRLYLRETRENYTREKMKEFEDKTIGTRRFYAFDHFGSIDNDEILDRIRYMVKVMDCKWLFLDHLSILVSGQEGNDERKNIDILMTKLRSLVEETNCALLLVSHLRRTNSDKGAEDGQQINLGHLRGSQSIAQLSDAVIALERNQQANDPDEANTTMVRVLKNRYAGEGGLACGLLYNRDTGRLSEKAPETGEEDTTVNNEYASLYQAAE